MVYIMELNGLYMKYYDHYSTYMGIIPNFWGKPMPSAPSPQNHHFFFGGIFLPFPGKWVLYPDK